MGILDELLAGGQRQKEYSDFVNRYEQGHPSQGYSDQEVLKRYGEVSHAVPPDQYAQAAQEALSKLSPEERAAFVKMLQDRAAARGVTLPGKVAPKPKDLGQVLTDLHKKPGSSGICLAVPLSSKRQGQVRSPTSCHPRWPRRCSRASRPWWSSASWAGSAAPTPAQREEKNTRHATPTRLPAPCRCGRRLCRCQCRRALVTSAAASVCGTFVAEGSPCST